MQLIDSYTNDRITRMGASLCTCWRIIRSDGIELGFTDHDQDISFTGTTFRAAGGATGTALENSADLAPDNADIVGVLQEADLGTDAIEAGRYDDARIEVWQVDWEDPAARLLLKVGSLGNIERSGGGYQAEFRSVKHYLDQVTGRLYGRTCDASLGDARCGVNLAQAQYRTSGTLTSEGVRDLTLSGVDSVETDWFTGGALVIDDGPLAGVIRSIRLHEKTGAQVAISLWEALPIALAAGTGVTLTAGCNKRFETCREKFSNSTNFRGFPHIPGTDVLTAYPSDDGQNDGGVG